MNTPNLFIAGAPKSGTTTLYGYLLQHPDVAFSSVKEPAFFDKDKYFSDDILTDDKAYMEYLRLFDQNSSYNYYGDATPMMVFPCAASRIKKLCGDNCKIVFILRNPISRAYSHYWHAYKVGLETGSPEELFVEEDPMSVHGIGKFPTHFLLTGRYWIHIDRFVEQFGLSNVLLLKFEDIIKDERAVMGKLLEFLGLSPMEFEKEYRNQSQMPIFPRMQQFLVGGSPIKKLLKSMVPLSIRKKIVPWIIFSNLKNGKYHPISKELEERLSAYYWDDNIYLERKYGFDISGWNINKE